MAGTPDDKGFLLPKTMDDKPKLTEKPGFFAIIPAGVRYDKRLSPNAKLLYGEITCLLNFNNKCFASNAYFARLYELSEVQISRLISQLVNCGHIVSNTEIKPTGTTRLISMPLNIFDEGGLNKNVKGGVIKNVKHNIHSINIKSLSEDKDNVLFIDFWNIFPNHKGLKTAFTNWNKLGKETHDIILQKVKPWLKSNADLFVPMPATWLNQERWNDEFLPQQPKTNGHEQIINNQYAQPINHDNRP